MRALLPVLLIPCLTAAEAEAEAEAEAWTLLRSEAQGAVMATPIGEVRFATAALDGDTPSATARALVALAAEAGLRSAGDADCAPSVLAGGLRLRTANHLVLDGTVLERVGTAATDRAAAATALRAAATRIADALAGDGDLGLRALSAATRRLERLADQGWTAAPDPDRDPPEPVAHLIAHGWLERWLPGRAEAMALRDALAAATEYAPTARWRGPGGEAAEWQDAVGRRCWTLATRDAAVYVLAPPVPNWFDGESGALRLRVALPVGADPLAPTDADLAAARIGLWQGERELATWDAAGGLRADRAAWRERFPAPAKRVDDVFPPHIAVADPRGDLRLLIVEGATLTPPRGGSDDAARFLADAARALPDAGRLDLLGQYCFEYAYDSPDPLRPGLPGGKGAHGDIHQTAAQTAATAAGGVCRGDCDDLADLYHDVLTRQDRNPIVLSLPGHLATAWAERSDAGWTVRVLQTGPAHQWRAATLPEALGACFAVMAKGQPFDPNEVSLSLRFANEDTRTSWRLGWRIFAEPEYARTMIDVQRDWHFRTYRRAIAKMERLIAAGDEDRANYGELAGLYRRTEQWDQAVDYMQRTIDRLDDPWARLLRRLELCSILVRARRHPEAVALARAIDDGLDADIGRRGDAATVRAEFALRLADRAAAAGDRALARDLVRRRVLPFLEREHATLVAWIRGGFDAETWDRDSRARRYRALIASAVGLADDLARADGLTALAAAPEGAALLRLGEDWRALVGFRDDAWTLPRDYAAAGAQYRFVLGAAVFDDLLAAAPLPAVAPASHSARATGLGQLPHDLAWIRASVPWWNGRLGAALRGGSEDGDAPLAPDPALVRAALTGLEAAAAAAARLGVASPFQERDVLAARWQAGLVLGDDALIDGVLAAARERGERQLNERMTGTLGRCAPLLSPERFADLLARWDRTVGDRPYYFEVAWSAARADGPAARERALAAARFATRRFPDDTAFAEEARYLAEVLGARSP